MNAVSKKENGGKNEIKWEDKHTRGFIDQKFRDYKKGWKEKKVIKSKNTINLCIVYTMRHINIFVL